MRIREICKEKNITLEDLANTIGTTQPNLSNIDNGKANPTLKMLEKIASALSVAVGELFEHPKKDNLEITCPNCGKSINLKVE